MDTPTFNSTFHKPVAMNSSLSSKKYISQRATADDAIRTYRALNRDVTYRKAENMEATKHRAEKFDHVASFAQAFREVDASPPGILMTLVDYKIWTRPIVSLASELKHSPPLTLTMEDFLSVQKGSEKHFTAFLIASASGMLCSVIFCSGQEVRYEVMD